MSLIIAYIGKKGCVIAADKRRIAFFGEKENRELLEADMYSGDITTDEELYKRAEELDVVLKISDARSELLKMLHSVKLQLEVQWKPKEKESTELQMPIRL